MNNILKVKGVTEAMYGYYCHMCTELSIEPLIRDSVTLTEYTNVMEIYLTFKSK